MIHHDRFTEDRLVTPLVSRRTLLAAGALMAVAGATSWPARAQSVGGWPVREVTIEANGVTLQVYEQGEGPAVLFCHGFPDTARTWASQMAAVVSAGYRAVALDMRGYGRSSAPADPALYTVAHLTGDMVAVLDGLGIPNATLVGHDWGANAVWNAAMMRPDRFPAVFGISVPYAPRGEQSYLDVVRAQGLEDVFYQFGFIHPDAEAQLADPSVVIPGALYWLSGAAPAATRWSPLDPSRSATRPAPAGEPAFADPAYVDHTVAEFRRTGFTGGLNYYRSVDISHDATPAFSGALVRQPSFYLSGELDGLKELGDPSLEELRAGAPGLVDHLVLPGVGHWPQHEAPEDVNKALLGFLAGLDLR